MISFVRKKKSKNNENGEYFKYRDSVTGHMNKSYACKCYEKLKHVVGAGCVMVRLSGCGDKPFYLAQALIEDAGGLIGRIVSEEICRIEEGDFLIFTENYESVMKKLNIFLPEFSDSDNSYAAAAVLLDANEEFDIFYKRIKRCVGAAEIQNMMQIR